MSELPKLELKKKIFLIVEGKNTETAYLEGLKSYKDELGLIESVDLINCKDLVKKRNARDKNSQLLNISSIKSMIEKASEFITMSLNDGNLSDDDEIIFAFDGDVIRRKMLSNDERTKNR